MKGTTKLHIHDKLPLTCSRTGTCCHGKFVMLNPWELQCMAKEKKISAHEFRSLYTELGGIRLKFNGKTGWKNYPACSQYIDGFGCDIHLGRPLACRLYPLGRQIQSEESHYMFIGDEFPCLEGCPEVKELPELSVGEYIEGQEAVPFEKAQDAYLDLMQNIADVAFVLLLDTGLAESGDTKTIQLWRTMGSEKPEALAKRIPPEWMEHLMLPSLHVNNEDSLLFVEAHNDSIQQKAQDDFGSLQTIEELHMASVLMMSLALHLARALGADPKSLSEYWIDIAKSNGASE